MICKMCGYEIPEDKTSCPFCDKSVLNGQEKSSVLSQDWQEIKVALQSERESYRSESFQQTIDELEATKKKTTTKIIVGIVSVVILLVVVLNFSARGRDAVKEEVMIAFENTIDWWSVKESPVTNFTYDNYKAEFELVLEQLDFTGYGSNLSLDNIGTIKTYFDVASNEEAEHTEMSFGAGLGDYTMFLSKIYLTKDNLYLGLPDLYENYLYVTMDEIKQELAKNDVYIDENWSFDFDDSFEDDLEDNFEDPPDSFIDQALLVGDLLHNSVLFFDKAIFAKTEVVMIDQASIFNGYDREQIKESFDMKAIEAQEIEVSVSAFDFQEYIHNVAEIASNSITNREEMDNFFKQYTEYNDTNDFLNEIRSFEFDDDVTDIVLGYLYLYDGKIVQAKVPFGEDDKLVISFVNGEDMARYQVYTLELNGDDEMPEDITMIFALKNIQDSFELYVMMADRIYGVDNFFMDGYLSVTTKLSEESVMYDMEKFRLQTSGEGVEGTLSMSGSFTMKEAEPIQIPEDNSIYAGDMKEEELLEAYRAIGMRIVNGNYIPEELEKEFSMMVLGYYYKPNMTYDEFKEEIGEQFLIYEAYSGAEEAEAYVQEQYENAKAEYELYMNGY